MVLMPRGPPNKPQPPPNRHSLHHTMPSVPPLLKCPFHQALIGTTFAAASGLYLMLRSPAVAPPNITPSPRVDLESMTEDEIAQLPYPPDLYPGGRWVDTPYGVIRVYEFGPEDGKKVVFLHGIGTPSCAPRDLIWELVEARGCRVIIFDLYGRGYSDSPLLTPHDARLFCSQVLFATTSSPLHWDSFSLIGNSFGGGVAVAFAALFPNMLTDLVLLAPSGILKSARLGFFAKLAIAGWVPNSLAGYMARRRTHRKVSLEVAEEGSRKLDPKDRVTPVDIEAVAVWQMDRHKGSLQSFLSSFRTGPLFDREAEWARAGEQLKEGGKKAFVVIGEKDDVVDPRLLGEMLELLRGGDEEKGEERVVGRLLSEVGHEFVVRKGKEVAREIIDFWKGEGWTEVRSHE